MHNSQGSSSLGGLSDGSIVLLRGSVSSRAQIHKFCLQCHASNGAQADTLHAPRNVKAPKVYTAASWTEDDAFNLIGAGGNFSTEINSSWDVTTVAMLGYGHSLGATSVLPPGGDSSISEFTCTNCHDPHGASTQGNGKTNVYRNLKVNATGAGTNSGVEFEIVYDSFYAEDITKSYVGGISDYLATNIPSYGIASYFGGTEVDPSGNVIWPIYRGSLTGNINSDHANSNSYARGDDYFGAAKRPSMQSWCAQCHDNWHERINTDNVIRDANDDPNYSYDRYWKRHPATSRIPFQASAGCAGGCHLSMTDRANYSMSIIQAGKGVPVTSGTHTDGTYGKSVYYLPICTDSGFSCGAGVMNDNSTVFCLTCHFAHGGPYYDALRWNYLSAVGAGSVEGRAVPFSKGCQLCHNRGG